MKHLDLEETQLMEEFSVYQPFTQFDEDLLQLEPFSCSESSLSNVYEDILKNSDIAHFDTEGIIFSHCRFLSDF